MSQSSTRQKSRGVMSRIFVYCINKLWLLAAIVIILAALLRLLLGLFLPEIDRFREDIITWVEKEYNLNIDIDKVSAEWTSQGPVLSLQNFKIKSKDEKYNLVEVGEVSVYFDLISSVLNGWFSTEKILINNADLKFFLDDKLGVNLNNDELQTTPIDIEKTSQTIVDLLFAQRNVLIKNSTLKLYTHKGTEFEYQINEVKVENFSDIHQLSGKLAYGNKGEIALVMELHGDPSIEENFSDVYISGVNIDISEIPWLESYPISKPYSGDLSWQLWGTWHDKHWQNVEAVFSLQSASWVEPFVPEVVEENSQNEVQGTTPASEAEIVNEITAMLSWQQFQKEFGYLSIHHLAAKTDSSDHTPIADIFMRYSRSKDSFLSWDLTLENLSLAPIANYIGEVADESLTYVEFLKNSDFALTINQLNASVNKKVSAWKFLGLNFEFSKLEYKRWKNIPRANGLSGLISVSSYDGNGIFTARDIELEFGDLFRNSIKAEQLALNFNWNFSHENQLRLNINHLEVSNSDLNINAKGAYFVQDEQPNLSLYAELTDVNAANKSLYLPSGIMTEELVSYLDKGVKSGRLPLAKSIVRGPLNEFPFDNQKGIFVAYGELENGVYEYLPDWPAVENLKAKLLFEGNGMDITASKGVSRKNRVLKARAYAKDFTVSQPMLELGFDVASQNNSGRDYISRTPINFIAEPLKHIDYQGKLKTHIDLDVPLSDKGEIKLMGEVTLDPKTSKISTSVIDVDRASGVVKFTEKGLSKSKLNVFYLDKKLDIKLHGKERKTSPSVSLNVKGVLPAKGISHFIGEQWRPYFNGEAEFSSVIQFSPVDNHEITRVLFQSDFKGMAFEFPDEFEKSKIQKDELFLTLEIGERNKGELKWRGIEGEWYWQQNKKNKNRGFDYGGDFYVNTPNQKLEDIAPDLRVSGKVNKVNFHSWLTFINRLNNDEESPSKNSSRQELVFESINVDIEELRSSIVMLSDTKLHIDKLAKKPWNLALTGEQGDIAIVLNNNSPWEVSLTDINISLNEDLFEDKSIPQEVEQDKEKDSIKNKLKESDEGSKLYPDDLVDMDINCKNCVIQEVDYGNILMSLRGREKALDFNARIEKEKQHKLSLLGTWQIDDDKNSKTYIEYDLNATNAGNLLENWGLNVGVEDSSGTISAKMSWDSSPWDVDYKQIEGEAQLSLGKGYLSEISDEDGRLFSLFNLQSLVRKLTFDFKDVYQKGFFYDSITGTFQLQKGVLSTENVEITGNVADVKLFGETNIQTEQIEQLAVVTPHLTSSLPVLAAWAIEPTTGLIVYLLDKLIEPAVEVATRIDYRIHGNYDDVKVDKLNTAKKKIKVEYESEVKPEGEESLQPTEKSEQKPESEVKSQQFDSNESESTSEPEVQVTNSLVIQS